ncbi:chaperone NapD [Pseudorhodoplanes sp.]|jgi:nitrate reductase NapD|uniref:chaperone NapD n=1 Tax=Pseudorhodoplanes sp. TaxID=1934341 RepID=UPI002B76767A|nr:chaperone NapD [Pseudorhodoplanes sp.]HWV42672.1 chaperone NapD [Pseudorhodoplanes sp.]
MRPHRRQFIRGQWIEQTASKPAHPGAPEIASVLVQARPECLGAVEDAITRLAGAEIMQRDARGKLVVVLDSVAGQSIGESLTQISLMPHVLSATLVFHAIDAN